MTNIRDSYKLYKESVDNPVDIKTYVKLSGLYNKFLMNKVLEGETVTLPCRLGNIYVAGRKQKVRFDEDGNVQGLAPDWVGTKKLWESNPEAKEKKQLLYHLNAHTDNVRYKYVWSKKDVLVKNKTLYSLRLTRTNKRAVHKRIIEGQQYITKY
jgi:hypothetical protein|tara:strand:- start:6973 stop:7434 length:462 start_codon:yes stop_codon:yes gene_type:complete